jgi:hypothetical protein
MRVLTKELRKSGSGMPTLFFIDGQPGQAVKDDTVP